MNTPRTIALLSKGMARYRYNFTEHFARAMDGRANVIAAPLGDDLWEVDYPALKAADGRVSYRDFPASWCQLDAWRPGLLGIMEYPLPMLRALFWARSRKVPVVVFTEVGDGEPKQTDTTPRTRWMHRLFAHLTDGQVALAPAARLPFGARNRPVHFAPHSIDTTEFTARPWSGTPSVTKILTVAQYLPRKGLDLMAAALAPLADKHRFEWRIVGTQDPAWLRQEIDRHQLTPHACIAGPRQGQELLAEFHQADVFVLPSRFDTYGVVTQEAAACGLPLIISRFAGSSQTLVQDGVNGFVVDPLDQQAFTQRLDELLSHPERWSAMGSESRQRAERYCVRRIANETAGWMNQFLPA